MRLRCQRCNWHPQPGAIILCDFVGKGPYYCPDCGDILEVVDWMKPPNKLHPADSNPQAICGIALNVVLDILKSVMR